MAILLKYVLFIIKRTVGEAKKKWKDLLAKAWIEDAKAQKTTFHRRGPLATDLIIIKAILYFSGYLWQSLYIVGIVVRKTNAA